MRAIRPLTEEQEIQRVIPFYGRTDFGDFLRMRTQKKVGEMVGNIKADYGSKQ